MPSRVTVPLNPGPEFPAVWREGLAYCEAGRVIVARACGFPVLEARVQSRLGHRFNSVTRLGESTATTSAKMTAFYYLSGEIAAALAPHFGELRTYHRRHSQFPSFTLAFREHRLLARSIVDPIWEDMGVGDSTKRAYLKRFVVVPWKRWYWRMPRLFTRWRSFSYERAGCLARRSC